MTAMLFFLASHGVQRLEESRLWIALIQRLQSLFRRLVQAHEHMCAHTHSHTHSYINRQKFGISYSKCQGGNGLLVREYTGQVSQQKRKNAGILFSQKRPIPWYFNSLWPLPTWDTHHYCPSRHCLLPRLLYLIRSHGHGAHRSQGGKGISKIYENIEVWKNNY